MLHKYGTTSFFSKEDVKAKVRQTNIERYGVDNALKSKEIRAKVNKTCLKRYGTPWHFGSEHALNKKMYTYTLIEIITQAQNMTIGNI